MGLCGFNLHRDRQRRVLRKKNIVVKRNLSMEVQQKDDSKKELPTKSVELPIPKKKVLRKRKSKKKG